jgi:CRISPR-associated protein Cas1
MELYLNTYGSYLHKKGSLFEVEISGQKRQFSPEKISSIVITTAATLSTDAIQMALEFNIDIIFIDSLGDPYGRIWFPKLGSTTYIRRRLLEVYLNDEGLPFVKKWLKRKMDNQKNFLTLLLSKRSDDFEKIKDNIQKMGELSNEMEAIEGKLSEIGNQLMGFEGSNSRFYFQALSELIPDKYKFNGRSSRPAKDAFNAFLNYGYGILYGKVEKALIISGLDPFIGLLHTDNYNKKSLVFDFIEPYRILIDKPVFYLFSRQKVKPEHVDAIKDGVKLNTEGKKLLIAHLMEDFDEVIRYGNRNIKRIDQILSDAHSMANYLIGKKKIFIEELGD